MLFEVFFVFIGFSFVVFLVVWGGNLWSFIMLGLEEIVELEYEECFFGCFDCGLNIMIELFEIFNN